MGRSTVHYADSETNNILKRLHNKLRPAGTPVERVEYIIELLLLRIFEAKLKQDKTFTPLRRLFEGENYRLLFSHLLSLTGDQVLSELNKNIFPFCASILTKARHVISGNMPTKMQDQLVLMEEVFANSNFTNNVKGGVIAEVIGLVNEIDEQRVLKTDILGDAIESALSETGGTKDLGLYRTPDHIRKMMVEMVDPDFTDTIYDPACGTSGFLFNAYEYVIEKARKTRRFPPEHIANQFYRVGIGGIEYQGRIRKMAAVNMYIRGLNPHNIAQGDSLKMYDPSSDAGSKSVVIANPPFGAERDQPAYPNVWEEYSRESETTILFVKLIFDLLKQGGRCAVVVSEGFLTWGQNSACVLTKLLLNEANLRAVISLPQGVFVSKGGQGAKTSVLYFEKGQPTDPGLHPAGTSFVWYYKIENDGFSMGTNRKPIEGSQIPQLVEIFKEIKQGKKPKDTKHSFCIPKEWIETLDPRVAERIKKEVKERFTEKNKAKREKLLAGLDEKLAKGKMSKAMYDEKLWQFDNVVESQIDNEVAKAIEKANSYHFNLQNCRSNLSEEQIREWQSVCHSFTICHSKQILHFDQSPHSEQLPHCHSERSEESQGSSIEKRYLELKTADSKAALQILASFDPKNSLQMDIAREYLGKADKQVLEKDEKLMKLFEIIKETKKYPFELLSNLLIPKSNRIQLEDDVLYKQVTIKLYGKGVILRQEILGENIKTEGQYIVNTGDFIMSKIDARNGAFGIVPSELDRAVVTASFPYFGIKTDVVNPKYLEAIVTQEKFYDQINNMVSGATGRRSVNADDFFQLQIPLPPLEVQNEIVEKIEKQKQIIDGAERIEKSYSLKIDLTFEVPLKRLGDAVLETKNGWSPVCNGGVQKVLTLSCLKNGKFDVNEVKFTDEKRDDVEKFYVKSGDFFYSRGNTKELVALAGIATDINENIVFPDLLTRVLFDEAKILPWYAVYLFNSDLGRKYFEVVPEGGTPNMIKVSQDYMKEFLVPYLGEIEVQRQIVEKLDRQMQALDGVRLLKEDAQKRIKEILAGVWGES